MRERTNALVMLKMFMSTVGKDYDPRKDLSDQFKTVIDLEDGHGDVYPIFSHKEIDILQPVHDYMLQVLGKEVLYLVQMIHEGKEIA